MRAPATRHDVLACLLPNCSMLAALRAIADQTEQRACQRRHLAAKSFWVFELLLFATL